MTSRNYLKKQNAFTLIELLVVIAIIALLLSILTPSLRKARDAARLTMCASNIKQIGVFVSVYQMEHDGTVPVMLNRFDATPTVPARARLLSLAFAQYAPETADLASTDSRYDPDAVWGWNTDRRALGEYFAKYLPNFYVCPFVRGRNTEAEYEPAGEITLTGAAGTATYRLLSRVLAGESYSVWRGELRKGTVKTPNHPYGLPHGTPKYGALSWNSFDDTKASTWAQLSKQPVKWNSSALRRIGAGSLASASIVYCEQGQTDSHSAGSNGDNGIYNYQSHRRGNTGGTNVLMADNHLEWVEGTQVGWP